MKQYLKRWFGDTAPYRRIEAWKRNRKQRREVAEWERAGRPAPPPHLIKQTTLAGYAEEYGLEIMVETGTYLGDMVDALKARFDQIYSIELSRDLFERAVHRFRADRNVELIHGDSGAELASLLPRIDRPCLFWLDGHYSAGVTARGEKDTPIYEELGHILENPSLQHVIIVDDARCFGQDPAYPTIEALADFVGSRKAELDMRVENDMIRITPRRP